MDFIPRNMQKSVGTGESIFCNPDGNQSGREGNEGLAFASFDGRTLIQFTDEAPVQNGSKECYLRQSCLKRQLVARTRIRQMESVTVMVQSQ